MQENGAAMATDARALVMVERHHKIVEPVGAPQIFVPGGDGETHTEVIECACGIVAPAVARRERP